MLVGSQITSQNFSIKPGQGRVPSQLMAKKCTEACGQFPVASSQISLSKFALAHCRAGLYTASVVSPGMEDRPDTKIGVLALQGSFREHCTLLNKLPGVTAFEVRTREQLSRCEGLVIPGGRSRPRSDMP